MEMLNKNCENCDHHCHCTSSGRCPTCPCINCSHDKQRTEEYYKSLMELSKHRD
jgi:hypothetical protein